jgi:RNA ligase
MDYQFPHITDIGQVLKAIKGKPEFVVKEADRHTIINYVMADSNTFPPVMIDDWTKLCRKPSDWKPSYDVDAAILRECRGIVFGPDGRVVARRLHKFFNVGEKQETFIENIDFAKPHVIMDKLDGSMITPIPIPRHGLENHRHGMYTIRWGSKMGITHVGMQVEEFVVSHQNYNKFAEACIYGDMTPIFEWCSRKQRIVIDYPQDKLVLIAVRQNVSGQYLPYDIMWKFAGEYKIPVCGTLPDESIVDGEEFVAGVREKEDIEGYVVQFDNGHMCKIKGEWYCRIHRAKESILHEKRVIEMIINEKTDDVFPFLLEHDKKALQSFVDDFTPSLRETIDYIWEVYQARYEIHGNDKKAFALASENMPHTMRSTIFAVWGKNDKETVVDHVKGFIRKNLGSGTKVNGIRWLWGDYKWADYIQAEDDTDVGV